MKFSSGDVSPRYRGEISKSVYILLYHRDCIIGGRFPIRKVAFFLYKNKTPVLCNEEGWHHVNSSLAGDNPVRDFFILCNLKNNERSGLLNEEKIKSV